jgi:hypothetical protein
VRKFNARHKLLISGVALSLLVLTLALLPKFGIDLPGILKSPRGIAGSAAISATKNKN